MAFFNFICLNTALEGRGTGRSGGRVGAAKYGGVKVFIVVSIAIFQRRNPRPTQAKRPVLTPPG